jgi:hypothetical protein
MDGTDSSNEQEIGARPSSLSLICILTFIFSGLACFSSLFIPLFPDLVIEFLKSKPGYDEALMTETILLVKAGWAYYLINFLLAFSSVFGAVLMWKLKKIGFHFYALANSVLLFVPTIFFGLIISWFGIFLAGSFIALYAFHLKYMS